MSFLCQYRLSSDFKEVMDMDIAQIVSIGVMGALLTVMLKKYSPEISVVAALATSAVILIIVLNEIMPVIDVLKRIAGLSGIDNVYIEIVLKVIAVSYISEFGVQLCNDAGVSSVGSKIELAGKVLIMAISAPILLEFLETVMSIV